MSNLEFEVCCKESGVLGLVMDRFSGELGVRSFL